MSDRHGDTLHVLSPADGSSLQSLPFLVHKPHGLAGVCCEERLDGVRIFVIDELRSETQVLTTGSDSRADPRTPRASPLPLPRPSGRESPSGQLSNRPGSPVGGSSPNNGNGTNRSNSPFDSPNGPRGTRCASTMASTPVGLPPTAR